MQTAASYYRARYYDQQGGRFLGEDLLSTKYVNNLYAYVINRPTGLVDPFGLFPVPECVRKLLAPFFPRLDWSRVDLHNGIPLPVQGFTWNNNIYIDPKYYNPHSITGIALIGHELTHVGQGAGSDDFNAWYAFGFLTNYYWDRNFDHAYHHTHFEREADDVEADITGRLLYRYGLFKDPCPEQPTKKPCGV